MARIFQGEAWIDDKFCRVTFVQAKDCTFDKSNFDMALDNYDASLVSDSEIKEFYMKHRIGYHPEYGKDGYWEGCTETERGASLFYYAKTKYVDS